MQEYADLLNRSPKTLSNLFALLGFEDTAAFSRFFKKTAGESITVYRKKNKHAAPTSQAR